MVTDSTPRVALNAVIIAVPAAAIIVRTTDEVIKVTRGDSRNLANVFVATVTRR